MPKAIQRSVGKPRAKEKTIRILGGKNQVGIARLSSDLAKVGDMFVVRYKESKIMLSKVVDKKVSSALTVNVLEGPPIVTAYASNQFAKSPFISLMGTLTAMGFPREVQSNLAGFYKATINKDGFIEFNLDREIK